METQVQFQAILSSLNDGLYVIDRNRRITYWNEAAERITGYRAEEVVGSWCGDNLLVHVDCQGCELCEFRCPMAATIEDGQHREAEVYLRHRSGHRVPVSVRITPLRDEHGEIVGGIQLFTDISSRPQLQDRLAELQRLTLLDPLTQLPNRRGLESQLQAEFERFRREHSPFGLLFLDVDHFKSLNDQFGHEVGDRALQTIAETLINSVRASDVVGRWGGEEFLVILPSVSRETLTGLAVRLGSLITHSRIITPEGPRPVTVSIGGTVSRPDDSVGSVVARADEMMYRSKRGGRARVTVAEHCEQCHNLGPNGDHIDESGTRGSLCGCASDYGSVKG